MRTRRGGRRHAAPWRARIGIALFPAAGDAAGRQGFARLINRSGEAGEVRIEAWDDAGVLHGPVTLRMKASEAVHFNSSDLEEGNAGKGLSGGIGSGSGDWRLALHSTLTLEVLSYIRTRDGFLTSMHDVVPQGPQGHRVVIFNPGRNAAQASRLRVVNTGEEAAEVRIEGTDDRGASPGSAVTLTLPARASRTLSARALESGNAQGLSGALGTGKGKWRVGGDFRAAAAGAEPAVEPDGSPDEPVECARAHRVRRW